MNDHRPARAAATAALIAASLAVFVAVRGDAPPPARHAAPPRHEGPAPATTVRVTREPSAPVTTPYDSARAARLATGDTSFAALVANLSEPGGYFDTDNIISNEASYLHPLGRMERLGVRGGAYIGVGPDQNYSYIAAIRPEIAFIIDIRRDNMLEHLLFKALFRRASSRLEYLALLFGRRPSGAAAALADAHIRDIVAAIDTAPPDRAFFDSIASLVSLDVAGFGVPLDRADFETIRRFHTAFHTGGLELRFSSAGRPPRPYYPSYRDLLLETDLDGRHGNFLASHDRFEFIKRMHARGLIVPVVGDLAGGHAMRAIANETRRRGLSVSAFYVSNVEFYLMRDRGFDNYAANVALLPDDGNGVIIRSLFGRDYLDPAAVRGYYSSQLLQTIASLVEDHANGGYAGYSDLITRRPLDLRR